LLVAKTNKAADMMISALINLIESTGAPKELLALVLRLGVEDKIAPALRKYGFRIRLKCIQSILNCGILRIKKTFLQ